MCDTEDRLITAWKATACNSYLGCGCFLWTLPVCVAELKANTVNLVKFLPYLQNWFRRPRRSLDTVLSCGFLNAMRARVAQQAARGRCGSRLPALAQLRKPGAATAPPTRGWSLRRWPNLPLSTPVLFGKGGKQYQGISIKPEALTYSVSTLAFVDYLILGPKIAATLVCADFFIIIKKKFYIFSGFTLMMDI